jgi:hypothetical protein
MQLWKFTLIARILSELSIATVVCDCWPCAQISCIILPHVLGTEVVPVYRFIAYFSFRFYELGSLGRAIAQAVSRWLPTAAARVRARVWLCGICGRQNGAGAFPLPILSPPIAPQSPSSIIWGLYNRPEVAAVPSGLSPTPLNKIRPSDLLRFKIKSENVNPWLLGKILGRCIGPPQGPYLHRKTENANSHTIRGFNTRDPCPHLVQERTCLVLCGHCIHQ